METESSTKPAKEEGDGDIVINEATMELIYFSFVKSNNRLLIIEASYGLARLAIGKTGRKSKSIIQKLGIVNLILDAFENANLVQDDLQATALAHVVLNISTVPALQSVIGKKGLTQLLHLASTAKETNAELWFLVSGILVRSLTDYTL